MICSTTASLSYLSLSPLLRVLYFSSSFDRISMSSFWSLVLYRLVPLPNSFLSSMSNWRIFCHRIFYSNLSFSLSISSYLISSRCSYWLILITILLSLVVDSYNFKYSYVVKPLYLSSIWKIISLKRNNSAQVLKKHITIKVILNSVKSFVS